MTVLTTFSGDVNVTLVLPGKTKKATLVSLVVLFKEICLFKINYDVAQNFINASHFLLSIKKKRDCIDVKSIYCM